MVAADDNVESVARRGEEKGRSEGQDDVGQGLAQSRRTWAGTKCVGLARKLPEPIKSVRIRHNLSLQRHAHRPPCLSLSPSPHPGRYARRRRPQRDAPCSPRRDAQDLGKSSNDLLGRDFYFAGTSLEVKTVTPSNVAFKVSGKQDDKTHLVSGELEAKYTNKAHGLVFTQAWTTTNFLRTQVEAENHLAQGLKFDLNTSLAANGTGKSALITTTYKQPGLHTRAFLDLFKVPKFGRVSRGARY